MSGNNNIKNKFENFEPEIDQDLIDASWEKFKIKNEKDLFVETEKKKNRKGFFFFLLAIIAVGSLYLLLPIDNNFSGENKKESSEITAINTISNKKTNNNNPNQVNTNNNTNFQFQDASSLNESSSAIKESKSEKTYELKKKNNPLKTSIKKKQLKNLAKSNSITQTKINNTENESSEELMTKNNENSEAIVTTKPNLKKLVAKKTISKEKLPEQNFNNQNKEQELLMNNNLINKNEELSVNQTVKSEKKSADLTNNLTQKEIINPVYLIEKIDIFDLTEKLESKEINPIPLLFKIPIDSSIKREAFKPLLYIDIFGGTNTSFSSINNNLNDNIKKSSHTNFSAGANFNYYLLKKTSFSAQYIFNSNSFKEENRDLNLVLVTQTTNNYKNIVGSDTTFLLDTTSNYVKYNKNTTLKSQQSNNFALGFGQQIMQVKKISIEGSICINLKQSKYIYETKATLESDTITRTSTPISVFSGSIPPYHYYNNDIPYYYPTGNIPIETKYRLSIGIIPSISAHYELNRNLKLFLKAAYIYDLSGKEISVLDKTFNIRENNLLFNFGLRFLVK